MNTMTTKIFLLVLLGIVNYAASAAQLRRTPKVYNALITTDDNLTPSRAFPVIQPTIHETGIASYPFGVFSSPYRVYNPLVRFAPPYPQIPYQQAFPPQNFPPQNFPPQNFPSVPDQVGPRPNELGPPQPSANPQQPLLPTPLPPQQGMPPPQNTQQPPFPVNEFGLPPSLYPLNQFPNQQNPVYLPPFAHPNYPMIPDGFQGPQRFPESYLPPYEYLPPGFPFGFRPPPSNKPPPKKYPGNPNKESAESSPEKIELSLEDEEDDVTTQIPLKNIKNHKNSKVPDVPPPPIPGKHKKQSQKQS
ncbi:hypothetical protein ACFFRR_007234 [Megaselia abdita]